MIADRNEAEAPPYEEAWYISVIASRWTPSDTYCVRRNTRTIYTCVSIVDCPKRYTLLLMHTVYYIILAPGGTLQGQASIYYVSLYMSPGGTSSYRDGHRRDTLIFYALAHAIEGCEGYILWNSCIPCSRPPVYADL